MKTKLILIAGLAALALARPARANLVVNGGFATGDLTGWTESGDTENQGVYGYPGNYSAFFGAEGDLGYISQSLPTVAGASYVLSYDLLNNGGTPSEAMVSWGGSVVSDLVDSPEFASTLFTETVVASSTSTTLSFGFRQDPAFFLLNNVNVILAPAPAPEPGGLALASLGALSLLVYRLRSRK